MNTAYTAIREQIELDIRDAIDFTGGRVHFGKRPTPDEQYPNATVVLVQVPRSAVGRQIQLGLSYDIEIKMPRDWATESDAEALKVEKAEALIQKLAPFTEDEPTPTPDSRYAGVAYKRQVELFEPIDNTDSEGYWSFALTFTLLSTVYQ